MVFWRLDVCMSWMSRCGDLMWVIICKEVLVADTNLRLDVVVDNSI